MKALARTVRQKLNPARFVSTFAHRLRSGTRGSASPSRLSSIRRSLRALHRVKSLIGAHAIGFKFCAAQFTSF
jgi:hypothetical protein